MSGTVSEPGAAGWRLMAVALACALLIGGVGGLIGFTARTAVPMNQMLSLVTLCTALALRWYTGLLVGVGSFAPAVVVLGLGGITAAWFAARLLSRVSDHRLERSIAVLLMAIGLLLVGERFLPHGIAALAPADPMWQVPIGVLLGLCIGTASTFLGVAGGELLIPTLVFVFGADIRTAGSATLFVSIPTVCMGLFRYSRMGLFPARRTLLRIGLPMGAESLVGAAAGGAFAGTASAEALKLLLGGILIAAALKAFWRKAH